MSEEIVDRALRIPIRIHFGDTDPYGVVYFASYFKYCHHGIEAFLRHYGLPPHQYFRNPERGFGLPVVEATCQFLKPVRYGDELWLDVKVKDVKSKSITFEFSFYERENLQLVARGYVVIVAIDRSWKACELPQELRKIVEDMTP
ncbi:MAG: acyl-CoA thioesterase [Syntrophobacterales bacterium]|nr:acyl-CoA thioesterase [Syntrophobacterales bacterium]